MTTELIYTGPVVGVTFEPAKSGLQKLAYTMEDNEVFAVELRPNPANPYDSEALEVVIKGIMIGHVPKPFNSKILRSGLAGCQARFYQFNIHDERVVGATIEVTREVPARKITRPILDPNRCFITPARTAPAPARSREQLNRLLMNLFRPFLAKFPETRFVDLLQERYNVGETRLMTPDQIEDLVEFMDNQLKVR